MKNEENRRTTLLTELQKFNDVPITKMDLEEIILWKEVRVEEKEKEKVIIEQVLKDAGVNLYDQHD